MPKLILTGGRSALIGEQKADQLMAWKWGIGGQKMPADKIVDLRSSNLGVFEVREIRRIDDDEKVFLGKDRTEEIVKANKMKSELIAQPAFEKTERMIRTNCFLLYVARGNRKDGRVENRREALFVEPIYSRLFEIMFDWFEKNPREYSCPAEIWQSLIPINRLSVARGWRRI